MQAREGVNETNMLLSITHDQLHQTTQGYITQGQLQDINSHKFGEHVSIHFC